MATEAISREPGKRGAFTVVLCALLLVLGAAALVVVNLLVWIDRTVLDTETFAATTDQALSEPAVEQRLSEVVAQRLVESEDFSSRIEARLPEDLAFAKPVIEQQLKSLIAQISLELLEADVVRGVRDGIIERLHARLIALLEGRSTVLETQGDRLVIDLRAPVEAVSARLDRPVPQRLQSGEGAEVVLLEDTTWLTRLSDLVRNRQEIILAALAVAIVSFGGAIVLAPRRRKGATLVGVAIIVSGVVTVLALWLLNLALESAADERVVLTELVHAFETNLKLQSVMIIALGAGIVAVTDERSRGVLTRAGDTAKAGVQQLGMTASLLLAAAAILFVVYL